MLLVYLWLANSMPKKHLQIANIEVPGQKGPYHADDVPGMAHDTATIRSDPRESLALVFGEVDV